MASTQQLLLGEGAGGAEKNYIEDVFSTYLYTGTGANQTITNGIDLSTKGGLVWTKRREAIDSHRIFDTQRGENSLSSDSTAAQTSTSGVGITSFNTNGFSLGVWAEVNASGANYASWTFRKQPKFFTQGTYTGNGSTQAITHDLGSAPGCVIVKNITTSGSWIVWHRGLSSGYYIQLNGTGAQDNLNAARRFGNNSATVDPTSTTITVGDLINTSGDTWVYCAFAHNAGGFGLTGTDNVISCGSFTTDGNGTIPATTLGYEPQYVMFKASSTTGAWTINDTMRGQPTPATANASAPDATLYANNSSAESQADNLYPTATGFKGVFAAVVPSTTYIYIAIRRGPMKVPTDATKVFAPIAYTGSGSAGKVVSGSSFPPDLSIFQSRAGAGGAVGQFVDRLRGGSVYSAPSSTAAEGNTGGYYIRSFDMDGVTYGTSYIDYNASGTNYINWMMKRAPSFFDEVCYTGTGASTLSVTHNLQAVPELMIVKCRGSSGYTDEWWTYHKDLGNTKFVVVNSTQAAAVYSLWNSTTPTSSTFTVGTYGAMNASTRGYVAYLFATCAGVSKCTAFTGNGSSQTINCGFTAGARLVMIKRTDSTGDWFIFDTSRGIASGNDPHLSLNTTAAEVTSDDTIDPDSTGFIVNQVAATNCNVNGASYIVLAIA